MAWHIATGINNNYPFEDGFPTDFLTSFISDGSHQYPYSAWRIGSGVNSGYPWKFWWFEAPVSDTGDMETGGSQSNYPGGFTVGDMGGISDQFDDTDMGLNDGLIAAIGGTIGAAMDNKILALDSAEFNKIVSLLNDPDNDVVSKATLVQTLYGANVYDGILLCKFYPFPIATNDTCKPSIYGVFPLTESTSYQEPPDVLYKAANVIQHYYMGDITLDIYQAWEVENIDYYIYLPVAGTFPLDVRAGYKISVTLVVDLLSGMGEYIIKQNGQITDIHKCLLGFDLPVNLSQGATQSNFYGFVAGAASKSMGAAGAVLGGIPHPVAQVAGVAANVASNVANNMVGHFDVSAPSIGGNVGLSNYPFTRVIAKIPKMFNEGYGYHETQGANRSTTYVNLSTCSGFVQCRNYKSDIIIATEDEKREIENLMNAGVFL